MGNLKNWNHRNPNVSNYTGQVAQNGSFAARSGQYFYYGGAYPFAHYLSQTVVTKIGNLYQLNFWLGHTNSTSSNSFLLSLFS